MLTVVYRGMESIEVIALLILVTSSTEAIDVCRNESSSGTGNVFIINGTQHDISDCTCDVKLKTGNMANLTFFHVNFTPCIAVMSVHYQEISKNVSCLDESNIDVQIKSNETVTLRFISLFVSNNFTTYQVSTVNATINIECHGGSYLIVDPFITTEAVTLVRDVTSTIVTSNHGYVSGKITERDLGILGGSIGGLMLLIVLIILVVCIVKQKKKEKASPYSAEPERKTTQIPDPGYTDIQPHTINGGKSGQIARQNKGHNLQTIEMEIIPNELYVGSDYVFSKQKTDEDIEIIENDLYVSSEGLRSNNQDGDRKFVIGPNGDKYAIVNKPQ